MCCVPLLLATGIMLAENTPSLIPLPASLQIPHLLPTLGTFASLTYSGLYVLLEPVAGTALVPFVMGSAVAGHYLIEAYGATANYAAISLHVVCWIAQFIGHGKFEGRAPALLDSLVQALFLAPLFVWLEFLFMLGYRPELRQRLDIGVEKELKRFAAEKRAKTNGKAK